MSTLRVLACTYCGGQIHPRSEWSGYAGIAQTTGFLCCRCSGSWDLLGMPDRPGQVCLCNVGVQECPIHPGHLMTQEEKIASRKSWDARVDAGKS